jgi:hypothetical protein
MGRLDCSGGLFYAIVKSRKSVSVNRFLKPVAIVDGSRNPVKGRMALCRLGLSARVAASIARRFNPSAKPQGGLPPFRSMPGVRIAEEIGYVSIALPLSKEIQG